MPVQRIRIIHSPIFSLYLSISLFKFLFPFFISRGFSSTTSVTPIIEELNIAVQCVVWKLNTELYMHDYFESTKLIYIVVDTDKYFWSMQSNEYSVNFETMN